MAHQYQRQNYLDSELSSTTAYIVSVLELSLNTKESSKCVAIINHSMNNLQLLLSY